MTSTFNPDAFMTTTTTESLSTQLLPWPLNDDGYTAAIKSVNIRTAKERQILDVVWTTDDEAVKKATGLPEPTVRQSIFLDLTDSGVLDVSKGKNIQLGRLREALGQNKAGKPWAPAQLIGAVAKLIVSHRMDGETTYTDVKSVVAL